MPTRNNMKSDVAGGTKSDAKTRVSFSNLPPKSKQSNRPRHTFKNLFVNKSSVMGGKPSSGGLGFSAVDIGSMGINMNNYN